MASCSIINIVLSGFIWPTVGMCSTNPFSSTVTWLMEVITTRSCIYIFLMEGVLRDTPSERIKRISTLLLNIMPKDLLLLFFSFFSTAFLCQPWTKTELLFVSSGNSQHLQHAISFQKHSQCIPLLTRWRICAFNHFKVNIPMTGHDYGCRSNTVF